MDKLVSSVDRHELWSLLSELRGKKTGTPISMVDLQMHFDKLLNNAPKNIPESQLELLKTKSLEFLNNPQQSDTDLSIGGYSTDFLKKMTKSLKNGKSAFLDGATNEILKHAMSELANIFSKFFNHIESSSEFPEQWKTSFLVPLHKKGSRDDPDNYRGLAVGSNIGKFYTKCLNEKIKNYAEFNEILSPHQFGFRDNFRTTDAIFSLRSIVSHYKNKGKKPIYSCFVDFSKAFDSVNRIAMVYKLGTVGIKGKMLKLISNMYNQSDYIIKSNGDFSYPIHSTIGVKQGCCLSPLFFNIFINDIHKTFENNCDPVSLNNWNINSLSFADDLVILSESPSGLMKSLKCLEKYCNEWGLKINVKKTKVLVFNKSFTKNIKNLAYNIDGDRIETTKSYCYLGIEMTNTGSFHKATDALYNKSLRALFSLYSVLNTRSDATNTKLYLKLFDSLIKPILLYGCEVWGTHISQPNNKILKFINKFYRILLGVPSYTSTVGVHIELGRFPIDINVHSSMLKYWTRLITLPKSKLVSHCYWSLQNNPNIEDPWLDTVKKIIFSSGQYHIWNNQTYFHEMDFKFVHKQQAFICQNLKDQFLQHAPTKMENESKLVHFKKAKLPENTLCVSKYLTIIKNRNARSLLSKLRLGVLPLEIEKGRRQGVARDDRMCKSCNTNKTDDEIHFLFECPSLTNYRTKHLISLTRILPTLRYLDSSQKLTFLYFNEQIPYKPLEIATSMLVELANARNL